ncbi:MAG TPA: dihydrofolate reductase family protein [Pirellulales bacterium]|nr:dihydrofolate reductase family protein [Pirellulales bacterium]
MPKLIAFNQVTVDGYFAGSGGDLSWAHKSPDDAEWNAFVAQNASAGGMLLFGRVTYEFMASFWPTPAAIENLPQLARQMNALPKVVFSRSLDKASVEAFWNNSRLVQGDMVGEVRRMKEQPGPDMAILGSGSIVAQLAAAGLIDEFQIVVNPIALGSGRTMFHGVQHPLHLKLAKTRVFGNGNVLLCYEPA